VLLWNNDVTVDVKSFYKSHIDVIIHDDISRGGTLRFTGFYGNAKRALRRVLDALGLS
jgi:predicted methyltransferase